MKITAKVIADSISRAGVRIITMELEYPRFIHSEFMTHRVFSRNAASSRAIPIDTMMKQVLEKPAHPVHWGANQAGMQAANEIEYLIDGKNKGKQMAMKAWKAAAARAVESAKELQALGLHKQIVNRVLEPFQMMKTVVTATEWDNFFMLRDHKDAQPEIAVLARKMKEAQDASTAFLIVSNEWHVPYVNRKRGIHGELTYFVGNKELPIKDALKVSASCCAQVSYRKNDTGIEKALKIYDQLVNMRPVHASPFEHQGTPILLAQFNGIFRGYQQYRKIIEGAALD